MSDLDREWKPKMRPQSTMAQAFSTALDSAFSLDTDVDHLAQTVDQKKQMMMIQTLELEALQAKIREAEERLKARQSVILDPSQFKFDEESARASRSTGEEPEPEPDQSTATARSTVETASRSDTRPSDQDASTDSTTSRDSSHGRDENGSSQDESSSDEQMQEHREDTGVRA